MSTVLMPHLHHNNNNNNNNNNINHHHPLSPPFPSTEVVPPIPPRTRSRPPSGNESLQIRSVVVTANQQINNNHSSFRFDDLPSPDREWKLLENIGDGTYGEVFRVS